jgi:hypothetical protein
MAKQSNHRRNGLDGKFVGVSTSADVRAFLRASDALTTRVTKSKASARAYIKKLERNAGISKKK